MEFVKAHGITNDFVMLIDLDITSDKLSPLSQIIANRRSGIGCDQVIFANKKNNVFFVRFFNPDGSEAETCGNGSRCIAKYLMQKNNLNEITLHTLGGTLHCTPAENQMVTVHMPNPSIEVLDSGKTLGHLSTPSAVSVTIGNPHLVCFVKDVDLVERYGEGLENHPLFPLRTNVEFVKVLNDQHLELKVWERGTGITPACGSGACAAMVAAHTHTLVKDQAKVTQPGGSLWISYNGEKLLMTGSATITFTGTFNL